MHDHKASFEASPGPHSSSAFIVRIDAWEDIPGAISTMERVGAYHSAVPLRALYQGRIAHLGVARNTSNGAIKRFIAGACLPALILVGDDDDFPSGPGGFSTAQRLLRWAYQVVVHGAGAEVSHYEAAVLAAEITGRFLMVECSSPMIPAWEAAARKWATNAVVQIVQPPPGLVHPRPMSRGEMQ